MLNRNFIFILIITLVYFTACKKDGFITSSNALLRTSVDTVFFDTVFTSTGSVTQLFKIFNPNNQKLKLSSVQLMGGNSSSFKINVDGLPGVIFNDIEINANDSIYVFAKVTINPNNALLPFVVSDSIRIAYNGNQRMVQLQAYGQNAHFLRNQRITQDTTWTNQLPIVILGELTIDSAKTLTINKGTKIYCNANAPILVKGRMIAIGEKYDSTKIVFTGDRLDEPYRDFPGSWPGIYFVTGSNNNLLQHCIIKNAYQGIITQNPNNNTNAKVTLKECIIDNIYDIAVGAQNSSITAENCLISNCGYNIFITAGGNYNFNHCTVASYGNFYLPHKYPVLTISNAINNTVGNNLTANFTNSIFYGEGGLPEDEIVVTKIGNTIFNVNFNNTLYKIKNTEPANTNFTGNKLKNVNPAFDTINIGRRIFNFRLRPGSPAVNAGTHTGLLLDLDGKNRNIGLPDLGCYELE